MVKTLAELRNEARTMENAIEWEHLTDKFIFCLDLLGLSAWDERADDEVEKLETAFEDMLEGA